MGYFLEFMNELWLLMGEMSYSLLIGFFIAGILSVFINPEFIEKHLGGKGFFSVLKASLFGVPLPICSCGVIPVSASIRRSGASKGATVSFLISTPQTGVDSIMVTYSLLGVVYGIFRPVAALINGVVGGILVSIFDKDTLEDLKKAQDFKPVSCCSSGSCSTEQNTCSEDHSHGHDHDHDHSELNTKNKFLKALHYGFVVLPEDIAKALILGLVISAVISVMVPDDFFASLLGDNRIIQYIIMLVIGIPVYVCSTGSVPVAVALIMKGISPGAALVFLMSGPATNGATISTIWKIMGKKTLVIYLSAIAVSSFLSGFLLDLVFDNLSIPVTEHLHNMQSNLVKSISAIALILIMIYAFSKRYVIKEKHEHKHIDGMKEKLFFVKGMTCNHCKNSVLKSLNSLSFIEKVDVDLQTGEVFVEGINIDIDKIKSVITELGYSYEEKSSIKIGVEGMTCDHCKNNVKDILEKIDGVDEANIDLKSQVAYIYGDKIDIIKIKKAIEEAGYTFKDLMGE